MNKLNNSTRFCLLCYKNTEFSLETDTQSGSIKKFTKVLNRLTKLQNTDTCLFEDKLLNQLNEIDELLVYCTKCQRTIVEICETFHTIKTLELQLDWKLDKIKEKKSYSNKVPSRWVNVIKTLDELHQNDLSKKPASMSTIRNFRKNVVNAADYRRLKSQPRVSLKRKEYVDEVTKLMESDHWTGVKLRENLKDNICPICGKKLIDSKGLQGHMKYHRARKERKAECPDCKRRFSKMYNLKIHMNTHIKNKSFKCPFCPVLCAHNNTLRRHLRANHATEKGLERELKRTFKVNPNDLTKTKIIANYGNDTECNEVSTSEEDMEEYEVKMDLEDMDDIEDNHVDKDENDATSTYNFNEDMLMSQNVEGTNIQIIRHESAQVTESEPLLIKDELSAMSSEFYKSEIDF